MTQSTSILIRVQARGGKFLGPDIGYSFITVRDVATGAVLAQSIAAGDSGVIGSELLPGSSSDVVFTQTVSATGLTTTTNWLSPTAGSPSPTAGFLATFELNRPSIIEISAAGMSNGVPNQYTTSVRMWLWPGAQLTTEPGIVLEMAGMHVQVLEPNPMSPAVAGQPIAVTAFVAMMCGCKIADGGVWPTSEFQVTAWLVASDGTTVSSTGLTIATNDQKEEPSIYTGTLPAPAESGSYTLMVGAVQSSLSNIGGSAITITV